jgi:hypothetical protein
MNIVMITGPVRDAQHTKHVIVADIALAKQVDLWKYALRSTNTI